MGTFSRIFTAAMVLASGVALVLPATAGPAVVGEEHCVVNVRAEDRLNVRSGPGAGFDSLGGLAYGRCGIVVMAQCQGEWCAIEDGHIAGFVHRHFIAMVSPARYCVDGVAQSDRLNLRAFPAAGSRVLTRLDPDQCAIAFLPYARGAWQKIRAGGWEGWVNRAFLSGQ